MFASGEISKSFALQNASAIYSTNTSWRFACHTLVPTSFLTNTGKLWMRSSHIATVICGALFIQSDGGDLEQELKAHEAAVIGPFDEATRRTTRLRMVASTQWSISICVEIERSPSPTNWCAVASVCLCDRLRSRGVADLRAVR